MAIPLNPIALYWLGDGYNAGPQPRITSYSTTLNVIILSFAIKQGATPTGAVQFFTPDGAAGTNLVADIATCRARGQQVWLAAGGAGMSMTWANTAEADAFIQSIKDINVQFGGSGTTNAFDALLFNTFEAVDADGPMMSYIAGALRAYYGTDFYIASAPAGGTFGAKHVSDRLAMAEMYRDGNIQWIVNQYYDGPGQDTQANIEDSIDYWNTAVTVDGSPVTIPKSVLGVGFGISNSLPNYWTAAEAATAYGNVVAGGFAPKGASNWSNQLDPTDTFASVVGPVINNNVADGSSCTGIAAMTAGSFTL